MVSEHVELFLNDFPGVIDGPSAGPELERDFAQRLPRTILDFMISHGFSGFGRGLFWLVDPARWQPTLEMLLETAELPQPVGELTAFGRTAFGDVYAWSQQTGVVTVSPATGNVFVDDTSDELPEDAELVAGSFFSIARPDSFDLEDEDGDWLFDRARAELGELSPSETYGFFPPLRLGGPARLENLQRVDVLAHLVILTEG
ncbi:hypothetical protein CGZ93_07300 [Enemella dayhoffiae]|uniref:DUF1851 domain-containing protein n=1 Tax=Enemella dayhoffiae TaxID=2016507 RepID=A0A255H536_9ACTN|nr:GAD-like domain-containing protein [Enemella dayhoffiae]OYO22838.1 hypothetical protein CGZ93_07300 [Enemella dayhoffiae]